MEVGFQLLIHINTFMYQNKKINNARGTKEHRQKKTTHLRCVVDIITSKQTHLRCVVDIKTSGHKNIYIALSGSGVHTC